MKKLLLLTAVAGLFAFTSVNAQTKTPRLSIGAEFAFPMGDYGDVFNLGYGGSLQYQHPVAANLLITGSAGYTNFQTKEILGVKENAGYIPVKAGARYYFGEYFFGSAEIGAAFGTKDGAGTKFAYSPGVGVDFPVSDSGSIELGARYEGWTKGDHLVAPSFIGLRLAYNFGI
ncbi:hypothetical protein FBD94_01975 [Pedobacter hiemivivus]|uniref:Outer membrane protein beta-barrel domain-containing protein n=1 Tax=Pedobacter hiemivivus TaxID=2530454 RepID=A0A4V5PDN3_9SPHI|nr:outer membrane beta-barrel protein [Pedobacter hiemivivus]TKC65346.1 hypothetical protein FBD94_01975 [Pedobacter hiemivivus]